MNIETQKSESQSMQDLQIVVAGTFTLDPLKAAIDFWKEELSLSLSLVFAPYAQVHQELLLSSSQLRSNVHGLNVLLIRIVDWQFQGEQHHGEFEDTPKNRSAISDNTAAFTQAVQDVAQELDAPLLVIICPSTSETSSTSAKGFLQPLERNIEQQLADIPGVDVVSDDQMRQQYPVADILDLQANKTVHIPYTMAFYSVLGTVITRRLYRIYSPPCKVIMVDADNTLWNGVCGEVGPQGVQLDDDFIAFQEYLIKQTVAGRLICVVSKNNEEDLNAVFYQRTDMRLRLEHITAISANWNNKSENIRQLAQDLNLGLDSIVFLDDDPVICAEVMANSPTVLTFQLPSTTGDRISFLNHLWVLDISNPTRLGLSRTALYRDHFLRESNRRRAPSLADFLAGLNLNVQITPLCKADHERVSELTHRTNQFNFTTKRLSAADFSRLLSADTVFGSVVRVTDRFGDYGLVGVLIYELIDDVLSVDSMLLSCRTLGRGVEHEMVAFLGQQAKKTGANHVVLRFVETPRNLPAKSFLYSIGSEYMNQRDTETEFVLPTSMAVALKYRPTEPKAKEFPVFSSENSETYVEELDQQERAAQIQSVAQYLSNSDDIHGAIESAMVTERDTGTSFVAPVTETDQKILEICTTILGVRRLGMNDDFFNLGVHSLLMMQIIAAIKSEFDVTLPIRSFFLSPTVTGISSALATYMTGNLSENSNDLSEAVGELSTEDLALIMDDFATPITEITANSSQIEDSFEQVEPKEQSKIQGLRTEFIVESALIETMMNASIESENQQSITTFAVATGGRPQTLRRCLESYLHNFSEYDRHVNCLIVDDSREQHICDEYIKILREVKNKFDCDLSYAGPRELRRFTTDLQVDGGIPESVTEFALSRPPGLSVHHSGNRNALLLASVDELTFNSDDDTLCRTTMSPNSSPGLGLTSDNDPSEYWFDPSVTQFDDAPIDLLTGLEKLLGRAPASIAREYHRESQICAHNVNNELSNRLTAPDARVSLAFPGLRGDCGWGSPFGYWGEPMGFMLLNENSHNRLTESEEKFRQYCASRQILRVTPTPMISDASFSMTTFLGMDNRELLPPFFPFGRASDVVFGWTTWRGLPKSVFCHAPWTLAHAPTEHRQFKHGELSRSASAFDIGKVLFACMESFQWNVDTNDPTQRLHQLGVFLMDLGKRQPSAFSDFMGEAAVKYNSRFISMIEQRLSATDSKPDYWARELDQYLSLLRESQKRKDYWVPLDLAIETSISTASERMQKYLYQFGELLQWWPAMRDAARALKTKDRNLGVAVLN